jgi:UDP-N-acetylglucosamine:LPS N-acetylglucosamine transferase
MEERTDPLTAARPTVLILSAGTGGGHESVAAALTQALEAQVGSALRVVTAQPLGAPVDRCYNWMLNQAPIVWGACFAATNTAALHAIGARAARVVRRTALERLIAEVRPDLILSVHALCAQAAAGALGTLRRAIPHHCVVTDLVDIHRTWIAPGPVTFYVATDHAYRSIRRAAVAAERVVLSGLPLRRPFWFAAVPPVVTCSESLRILLMDGGHPGPALPRALRSLLSTDLPLDITVVGGASCLPATGVARATSVRTMGMLSPQAIARLMAGTDVLVTKAGSVTIAEALAVGCPIVLHRAAPGQEASNPALVEMAGAGRYAPSARRLAAAVRQLAEDPSVSAAMATRARLLGKPGAALIVAEQVCAALGVGSPARYPHAS